MKRRAHISKETYIHQKRPIYTSKETYMHEKRPAYIKRDRRTSKETYIHYQRYIYIQRGVYTCTHIKKRPTYMKRAPQKRRKNIERHPHKSEETRAWLRRCPRTNRDK